MGHPNVTVGQFFIHELHTTTLYKTITVFGRGATFCRLNIFAFWVQAKWDVSPLDKIGETPSIYHGNGKSHLKQLDYGDQVLVSDTQWGVPKGWGRGQTTSGSLPELLKEPLSASVPDIKTSSLAERHSVGKAGGHRKSVVIWQVAGDSIWTPGLWRVTSLGSPEELVVTPVITAMSASGTLVAQWMASLAVADRLAWISSGFQSSSPVHIRAFHFVEGGPLCSERRRWEATLVKARTNGERHGYNSCCRQEGERLFTNKIASSIPWACTHSGW